MSNLKISVVTEFLGKGLNDANKSVKGLEGSVKKLGYLFGGGYLGTKIASFAKSSVKAFIEDEKAAAKLTNTINNLGLSLSAQSLNNYVERLSLATGVIDDQLRPALQALLQVTGSVTQSQKLLAQAVDVSAGTGEDLLTVANDLAQAYVGNTRGLRKYNLGLTQAELKAASFADIQQRLTDLFSGANAAYLTTYSGKTQRLTTAWGEFKEKVGNGVVAALLGEKGKPDSSLFLTFLDKAGTGIQSLGVKLGKSLESWSALLRGNIDELNRLNGPQNYISGTVGSAIAQGAIIQAKVAQDAADKRERERLALAAKTTAEKKNQLALDKARLAITKASANYDITKIQLAAALKGKVSEEEKKRLLELQKIEEIRQAIAEDNGKLALELVAQLDAARKKSFEDELARSQQLAAAIIAVQAIVAKTQEKIAALALEGLAATATAIGKPFAPSISSPYSSSGGYTAAFLADPYVLGGSPESLGLSDRANTARNAAMYGTSININVAGSVTTESDLVQTITNAMYNNQASGVPSNYTTRY